MLASPPGGICLINARIGASNAHSLRIVGSRIAAVGCGPRPHDRVLDVHGDRVLPGLINAHDHLQLNTLPHLDLAPHYRHVREWIEDVSARRRSDPVFAAAAAAAYDGRLIAGGLKNLLSGVTTVAHHDALFPLFSNRHYPTRVVTRYGWSHSLYIDGEQSVGRSYRATPAAWPWIIHAAEGVDTEASGEFDRLDALGCIGSNTLIVHGIALDAAQRWRLEQAGAGLIWCPSSNLRLFASTARVSELLARGRVALGTDSRLSGTRDLLAELNVAAEIGGLDEPVLESLVTAAGARLLRLPDRGVLEAGALGDLLILPAHVPLSRATRADVRLVLIDGSARYGEREYAQALAPASQWMDVQVDGRAKVLQRHIAALMRDVAASEPGFEPAGAGWRAA